MKRIATRRSFTRLPLLALAFAASAVGATVMPSVGSNLANAAPPAFVFTTGSPNGLMGMASGSAGATNTEAADDFMTSSATGITSATFTGLVPTNPGVAGIQSVRVEFYNVFPLDSTNPPDGNVPTRTNSPSDVELIARDTAANTATFSTTVLNPTFSVANSVTSQGIHPLPNQMTGGEGSVTGEEVQFAVSFATPVLLSAGHYFFVPQVQMSSGKFLWLSAPKPIVGGSAFSPDLQTWIRTTTLEPDWLRVGTDIVGGQVPPQFNGAFSLAGETCVPLDATPNPLPDATAGSPYSQQLAGSGGTGPYVFSETGALPTGITLTPGGLLAGTTSDVGTFPLTVTVTDAGGCSSVLTRSLFVAAAAATTTTMPSAAAPTSTAAAPTTVTVPPTAPAGGSLPATGRTTNRLALIALLLVVGGSGVLSFSRRRRPDAG